MQIFRFVILLILTWLSSATLAKELVSGTLSHSSYQLHIEQDGFRAGEQLWLAIRLEPKAGWHTYWKNPGDSGAAPFFEWKSPDGITIGNALYSIPSVLPVGPLMNYGYHENSTLLFPLFVNDSYTDKSIKVEVIAEWLVCEIECVPQVDNWSFDIKQNDNTVNSVSNALFIEARAALPEPSYWDSNLTISNDNSQLLIFSDKLDVPEITQAYFFPEAEGVLTYAAPQTWKWNEHGLLLSFERTKGMPAADVASGLLKLQFKDGSTQAFELQSKLTNNIRTVVTNSTSEQAPFSMPIWQAALFALIGGAILNLMPCVFPVLSLKAFALISATYKSVSNRRKEGWAYTFGIWISFMFIVGVLVALKAGGAAIGWGFQLQEPLFIAFLILLMVLVALSLAGVFYINTGAEGAGQSYTLKEGVSGAFAKGVLATLVATPCTAPFMAPAIGYALTQPLLVILLVFSMLAFGLALPFLALSYSDTLARMMPRPGVWMEKVKQGLAFPMLLTAAWLLYVYDLQAGSQAALFMVISAITLSFGVWLYQQTRSKTGRAIAGLAMVSAIVMAVSVSETNTAISTQKSEHDELAYSQTTLEAELAKNNPVFVYFTAEWCITCKVNEQVALFTDDVQKVIAEKNIQVIKGDWTNRNAEIASKLAEYGRAGVPLYLYFPAGEREARVLPEILSKDIVIGYLTNS